MEPQEIIKYLPYSSPFLFVDELKKVDDENAEGEYTFKQDEFFYKGHFKENPITPGVILTECMAQIGVVSIGIFILKDEIQENFQIALSSSKIDFYLPVLPGEKVTVTSQKEFFRFQKLKCQVAMHNQDGKLVCRGEIAGMIKSGNE